MKETTNIELIMPTFKNPLAITTKCPLCGKTQDVVVESTDYADFLKRKHAQDAFPYLSASERELLISGICEECWNRVFPETE